MALYRFRRFFNDDGLSCIIVYIFLGRKDWRLRFDDRSSWQSWLFIKIKFNLNLKYFIVDGCLRGIGLYGELGLHIVMLVLLDKVLLIGNYEVEGLEQFFDFDSFASVYFQHFPK